MKLDVSPDYYGDYKKVAMAKQGDVHTRFLKIEVCENGKPIDVTKYYTALNIKKPSGGTFVTRSITPGGKGTDSTCVYFKIFKNMLDEIGHVTCDVSLYQKADNVSLDTDGGIYHTSISIKEAVFISKVEKTTGQYVFKYDGSKWKLKDVEVNLGDYGITIADGSEIFSEDKIIVTYNDYILLTTEDFFIVVDESIYQEDYKIPTDEGNTIFEYFNAADVDKVIKQTHTHDNKSILDNTTESYTTTDKEALEDTVRLTGDQVINGTKTFDAPINVSGTEQATVKIKTSNGGQLIIGKEGNNSGTMLRFDQVEGTPRLLFRSSATQGAMVWEQPEQNAQLYIDLGKTGADYHRISMPSKSGQIALTSQIPTNYVTTNTEQTITAKKTFSGDVTIGGNLNVTGTTTTVGSTTLQVKDKLIEVAHGNTTSLTTPAGIVAPKYDGTSYGALVFDNGGTAYVGDVAINSNGDIDVVKSDLQALATRTSVNELTSGNLMKWDGTNKTLVDSGIADSNVAKLSGGNIFTGTQTLNSPSSNGYSINASGYVKGSWGQFPSTGHQLEKSNKVCVLDESGWIRYRTPVELFADIGGAVVIDAIPKATTDTAGIIKIATADEITKGTSTDSAITPAQLANAMNGNTLAYVPSTRTINDHELSSDISLDYSDVSALPTYTIGVYKNTGGSAPVAFCTVDYSACDSENGTLIKIGMVCSHGNASSYRFFQDVILSVTYKGSVAVDTYKYFGADVTYDSVARQFGDICYTIDTTDKIVTFYTLMGQFSTAYSQPYLNLNGRTKGVVTQLKGTGTAYSSGTLVWGNNSDFAKAKDVVTLNDAQTITGAKTFSQAVMVGIGTRLQADSNGAMEFGRTDGVAGTPYIDFHANATSTDYDARIIVSGGSGSSTGSATMTITASKLKTTSFEVNEINLLV